MKIEFFPEICCDDCNDVIHNHMNCPSCKASCASTSAYGELDSSYYKEISCNECDAKFKLINSDSYDHDEWEWEKI